MNEGGGVGCRLEGETKAGIEPSRKGSRARTLRVASSQPPAQLVKRYRESDLHPRDNGQTCSTRSI